MKKNQKKWYAFPVLMLGSLSAYAAVPVHLDHQSAGFLQSFYLQKGNQPATSGIVETSRDTDFNQTLHIRFNQTYHGYPVMGGEGIAHIRHAGRSRAAMAGLMQPTTSTMNGVLYQNIQNDLANTPATIFTAAQSQKALQQAIKDYQQRVNGSPAITDQQSKLMVYVDKANKAHWIFRIDFYAEPVKPGAMPAKQVYIMDAASFQIYQTWNDIKTDLATVEGGGGVGGNLKTGKFYYDGLNGHYASFNVLRNNTAKSCFLKNDDVIVKDNRTNTIASYPCEKQDAEHNNVYWNITDDYANGGYSPNNDAIFTISRIKEMYEKWYGVAPVMENNKPVPVTVYTHKNMENAWWEGKVGNEWRIRLGDGADRMYPSTAPGVIAHELGHGFTEQHSKLFYLDNQSGGLNESFSDMADQAAQYYALGQNNWMHDAEITKAEGKALRYLDKPSKDCEADQKPGQDCSVDHVSQMNADTDVHYSSGIFNHVFYLIGTTKGWDAKKAFDVMVKANMHYWTAHTTFSEAACGVIKATKDYKYDVKAVFNAFAEVGVDTKDC